MLCFSPQNPQNLGLNSFERTNLHARHAFIFVRSGSLFAFNCCDSLLAFNRFASLFAFSCSGSLSVSVSLSVDKSSSFGRFCQHKPIGFFFFGGDSVQFGGCSKPAFGFGNGHPFALHLKFSLRAVDSASQSGKILDASKMLL